MVGIDGVGIVEEIMGKIGCDGKIGVIVEILKIEGKMLIGAIGMGSGIGSAGTRAGAGSMVVVGFKDLGSLTTLKSIGW